MIFLLILIDQNHRQANQERTNTNKFLHPLYIEKYVQLHITAAQSD